MRNIKDIITERLKINKSSMSNTLDYDLDTLINKFESTCKRDEILGVGLKPHIFIDDNYIEYNNYTYEIICLSYELYEKYIIINTVTANTQTPRRKNFKCLSDNDVIKVFGDIKTVNSVYDRIMKYLDKR